MNYETMFCSSHTLTRLTDLIRISEQVLFNGNAIFGGPKLSFVTFIIILSPSIPLISLY